MKAFHWTNNKVIDFVNWYIDLHKLPFRYKLENQTIVDSFKRGDDFKLWHKNLIERDNNMILNETKNLLTELHTRLNKVDIDFNWSEFIDISLECQKLQGELKNIRNVMIVNILDFMMEELLKKLMIYLFIIVKKNTGSLMMS